MGWKLLTTPPTESGRYIVAHKGYAEVIHYLDPDGNYLVTAKLGWRKNPREFGATHYMALPCISDDQDAASEADFAMRGITRLDPRPRRLLHPVVQRSMIKPLSWWRRIVSYPATHTTE